jgi:hypothetical protein
MSITNPKVVRQHTDCSATVFVGYFWNFLNIFCPFCWCLQLTYDWPCNNPTQEPLSDLKNVLQKPPEHFKSFGSGLTQLQAKYYADTLLNFAIHHRQNEARIRESICVTECLFTAPCQVVDWRNSRAEILPLLPPWSSSTFLIPPGMLLFRMHNLYQIILRYSK